MNTDQLESIMQSSPQSAMHFGGVFPADYIEEIDLHLGTHFPQAFIFNYDPSHMPGSHWVAAIVDKPGKPDKFFDSYGKPPSLSEITNLLSDNYIYNKVQLQHPMSAVCGQWCIFFLWHTLTRQEITLKERFDSGDTLGNDTFVNHWVSETFKKELKNTPRLRVVDRPFLANQIARQMDENLKNRFFPQN